MPELLNDSIKTQVRQALEQLKEPVQILVFTSRENCDYCAGTRQLAEEVAALSDKLGVSVHDLQADAETARQYRVAQAPSLVLAAKDGETLTDKGIRFTGIPAGHEFTSLIQGLLIVSSRDSGLKPQTREFLQGLKEPLHLQVFVTPT
jgi:alkyl hydroperoxide reductase subunit AhpF